MCNTRKKKYAISRHLFEQRSPLNLPSSAMKSWQRCLLTPFTHIASLISLYFRKYILVHLSLVTFCWVLDAFKFYNSLSEEMLPNFNLDFSASGFITSVIDDALTDKSFYLSCQNKLIKLILTSRP